VPSAGERDPRAFAASVTVICTAEVASSIKDAVTVSESAASAWIKASLGPRDEDAK
jgi:hypothetical protein